MSDPKLDRQAKSVLRAKSVLIVEDEYFIADDMARSFRDQGFAVIGPAPSVTAALGLIAGTPDLDGAVLDINLQGETVFPVADALVLRAVPFVFATGYDASAVPPSYSAIRLCEKPVDPAHVSAVLFE